MCPRFGSLTMNMNESTDEHAIAEPPEEPSESPTDRPRSRLGEFTQWSLVSADGRANIRLRDRMVVGSGECCDLRLEEDGISLHHALISVESAELYVTPLSTVPTRVDGEPVRGRQRVSDRATLGIGAASFKIQCVEDHISAIHAGFREDIAGRRLPSNEPPASETHDARASEIHAGFRED